MAVTNSGHCGTLLGCHEIDNASRLAFATREFARLAVSHEPPWPRATTLNGADSSANREPASSDVVRVPNPPITLELCSKRSPIKRTSLIVLRVVSFISTSSIYSRGEIIPGVVIIQPDFPELKEG